MEKDETTKRFSFLAKHSDSVVEAIGVRGNCSGQVPVQLGAPVTMLKDPGAHDLHTDVSVVELEKEDIGVGVGFRGEYKIGETED